MSSVLVVLLIAVLNMLPANVQTFTMEMAPETTIQFTKQKDGGWVGSTHPGEEIGTFYVNGTKMTVKSKAKEHTDDFAQLLGTDEKTDWKTIGELKVGPTPLKIERKTNGVDFVLKQKNQDREETKTFKVRWEPGKTE